MGLHGFPFGKRDLGKILEHLVMVTLEHQSVFIAGGHHQLFLGAEEVEFHHNISWWAIFRSWCQGSVNSVHFKPLYRNWGSKCWNSAVMLDWRSITVSGMLQMQMLERLAPFLKSSMGVIRAKFSSWMISSSPALEPGGASAHPSFVLILRCGVPLHVSYVLFFL